MSELTHDSQDASEEVSDAIAADNYAKEMDDILMDIADLNPEICPPDRRFMKGDREAWVYEHGNIAELVFVKTS